MTPIPFKVRDPIHAFITLTPKQGHIVNTEVFQRMRRIRQLAWANLVYPGATHTRFSHTLGVFHVASQMGAALNVGDDGKRLVEYAALLHDLGHGPFSHVSESVLERFATKEALQENTKQEKIHELVTEKIIRQNEDLLHILGQDDINQVVSLLKDGTGHMTLLRHIISGPLDADKQDYLLRDSYFCGVDYGQFDIAQMHRELAKSLNDGDQGLCVNKDGLHAIEQFVMAKYYMTCQIYRHKVRIVTDQMLTRALVLGITKDNIEELAQLYTYDGSSDYIRNFLKWDDERLMATFTSDLHAKTWVGQILRRLRRRDLFKRVFTGSLTTGPTQCRRSGDLPIHTEFTDADNRKALKAIRSTNAIGQRRDLEHELAQTIAQITNQSIDPNFVVVHHYSLKSVREQSKNGEESIKIREFGVQQTKRFEDVSAVFNSIRDELDEEYIEVYAPIHYNAVPSRESLLQKLHDPIRDLLMQVRPVTQD